MSKTVFITGANRGLGLEFTKQYLQDDDTVIATCRHPEAASELQQLAAEYPKLSVHQLDVTDFGAIQNLAKHLRDTSVDVLINNAGISGESGVTFGDVNIENLLNVIKTNSIAPLKILEAFHQHLNLGQNKVVVNISSVMGSIADNTSGARYAYRTSKTALNMLMRSAAVDLAPEGIKVLILHPGWVATDMGGKDALVSVFDSVTGMRNVIENHQAYQSGEFYDYLGKSRPW